jgi:hypothetical protein
MDIPGAVSGVSLGADILVLDEKGLEEEAIDLRCDDGDGDGFDVIVDIPRLVLVDASVGTYVRAALSIVEDEDADGSLLIAEKAGRNDMVW